MVLGEAQLQMTQRCRQAPTDRKREQRARHRPQARLGCRMRQGSAEGERIEHEVA
jgi:hypothetical protein